MRYNYILHAKELAVCSNFKILFFLTLSPTGKDEKESNYFVIIIALTRGVNLCPKLLKYF